MLLTLFRILQDPYIEKVHHDNLWSLYLVGAIALVLILYFIFRK